MSYIDSFIQIADDSSATTALIPVAKNEKKPAHLIQYELLSTHPYKFDHEDLVFEVYVRQKGISAEELEANGEEIRVNLLQKGHPCLRASALTKQYGWGAHYNSEGKIALYAVDSGEYQNFVEKFKGTRQLLMAMRKKRA